MQTFDNLTDDLSAVYAPIQKPVTRKSTGNAARLFVENCRKCGGTGKWVGSGFSLFGHQIVRRCFGCDGTGKKEYKTSTASRDAARAKREEAKQQQADALTAKADAWKAAHKAEWAWLESRRGSFDFATSLADSIEKWGSLTEKQLAAVQKLVKGSEERKQAQVANAVDVPMQALQDAFAKASSKLKWPKLRMGTESHQFVFSLAGANSKNPGAVYVKDGETYLGKVAGGKLFASRDCSDEQKALIVELSKDPLASAVAYGRLTGSCSACGAELTDPVSVERGIGPICAERFF
jgi:hypothetical protein